MKIDRDEWGVPHIHADSEIDAVFAQGYAQAEDRLPTIIRSYRKALGRMAAVFGPEWIEHDFRQRIFRHEAVARAGYTQMQVDYQQLAAAFAAGIKHFMQTHPAPKWSMQIEPWHVVALARALNWQFVLRQCYHDLGQAPPQPLGAGSNAWAFVSGDRVYFVSDPHLPWEDEWLMHECYLKGGDLDVHGFQSPGLPYVRFGHNNHIAWTFTSGGPDVADVYRLTLDDTGERYQFDGTWRDLHIETFHVQVYDKVIERQQAYSHHGPVMLRKGTTAYAFCIAYADRLFEHVAAYASLNKARSTGDVRELLTARQFGPFNILVADTQTNIFWQATGAVPLRPKGYDWLHPVPGDTSATDWLDLHPTSDLPQLVNPPWIQHCNVAPWATVPNSPLTEENYPSYLLYGEHPAYVDGSNPRGRYLSNVLSGTTTMTVEQALGLVTDCTMQGATLWLKALFAAYSIYREDFAHLESAIRLLQAWDRQARQDRVGMTIFWEWYLSMPETELFDAWWNRLLTNEPLTPDDQVTLLDALDTAVDVLTEQWGSIEVPWRDVYQVRRGTEQWAVDGGMGMTLRVVGGSWDPDDHGTYHPNFGQACPMLVILGPDGVYSYSALPFGQSEDPQSLHFTDQGWRLFAHGKLKEN